MAWPGVTLPHMPEMLTTAWLWVGLFVSQRNVSQPLAWQVSCAHCPSVRQLRDFYANTMQPPASAANPVHNCLGIKERQKEVVDVSLLVRMSWLMSDNCCRIPVAICINCAKILKYPDLWPSIKCSLVMFRLSVQPELTVCPESREEEIYSN